MRGREGREEMGREEMGREEMGRGEERGGGKGRKEGSWKWSNLV